MHRDQVLRTLRNALTGNVNAQKRPRTRETPSDARRLLEERRSIDRTQKRQQRRVACYCVLAALRLGADTTRRIASCSKLGRRRVQRAIADLISLALVERFEERDYVDGSRVVTYRRNPGR